MGKPKRRVLEGDISEVYSEIDQLVVDGQPVYQELHELVRDALIDADHGVKVSSQGESWVELDAPIDEIDEKLRVQIDVQVIEKDT